MNAQISPTAVIHPHVKFGKNVIVEDFCVIGVPVNGQPNLETTIGDDSHIRSHTVIYAGNQIGRGFRTGNKANIRELNEIGDDVSVGTLSIIEHHVRLEDKVRVHSGVFIPEYSILRAGAWVGPGVVMTNARYPNLPSTKHNLMGPELEAGARIGANATLLPGVVIGRDALVGAGAVVTKN
ncbi:MAG: N-acetyltransferase, partial [Proteobacteria bacterium]